MEYSRESRYFRRLNPKFHFTLTSTGAYRVTSAAFKSTPRSPDGRYANSVDAEILISLAEERVLAARQHPGYGIGVLVHEAITNLGASIVATPSRANRAHHDLLCTERQSRKLAEVTEVIDWPASLQMPKREEA
jgi:hypothetical protein